MAWVPVEFKGKQVWAEADTSGRAIEAGGLRRVRYTTTPGAKLYSGSASGMSAPTGPVITIVEAEVPAAAAGPNSPSNVGATKAGFGKAGTRTAAQTAAARADGKARIDALGPEVVRAFTDGACHGNPGPAGAGCLVRLADGRVLEAHRALGEGTNNIAELVAIGLALETMAAAGVPKSTPVAIFSDSNYARGVLTQGWKAQANVVLIRKLKEALSAWPGAELHWIAGHAGIAENERADRLAELGVRESR